MATEPPKRKRRWFRFSLKMFVVVLTVFCVWLGLLVHRVNKQKEAVQWVKDQGGAVFYDFEWNVEGGQIDDPQPPGPDWLRELIGVDYFADVVKVNPVAMAPPSRHAGFGPRATTRADPVAGALSRRHAGLGPRTAS